MIRTLWSCALLGALAAPALGQGLIISLDQTRTGDEGEPGGPRYLTAPAMANATQILQNAGFTIRTTDRFISGNIGGACVLYTGTVQTNFTNQELDDIINFVQAGGGLVVQRDHSGFYPASDALLQRLGISFNTTPVGPGGQPFAVNRVIPHPIWDGPAGNVSTYNQVFSSSITGGMTIVGNHASGQGALGVLELGRGRVVFTTDMDAWDDFGDPVTPTPNSNNAIVWENMFWYTCIPSPGSGMALGMASIAALRRRR